MQLKVLYNWLKKTTWDINKTKKDLETNAHKVSNKVRIGKKIRYWKKKIIHAIQKHINREADSYLVLQNVVRDAALSLSLHGLPCAIEVFKFICLHSI